MRLSSQGLKSLASSIAFGTAARNVALGVMLPVALASTIVAAEAKPAAKAKAAHAAPAAAPEATGAPATYMPGAVPPPGVNARSWVLVDATSNTVLASGNADERVEPASLTKLMTAYLVFEALDKKKISMEQIVTPSAAVRRVGTDESRMFIEADKPVSVHDLVYGMIIQSGNDAAIALAELVGGSEAQFVNMMNDEAKRLGMKGTHFADVNGMPDPNHYTTAGDLATLSAHLIRDFPQYYSIFSEKEFKYNNIRQGNRNRLLWLDPTVDGLKTGHTQAAGFCLISSAKRQMPGTADAPRRLVSVMMGETKESDRTQDSMKMLNYGYSAFDAVRLFKGGQAISTPRLYKGKSNNVQVGVKGDQWVTVPRGLGDKVKTEVEVNVPLIAPLADGQPVGTVKIVADGKTLSQFPVVALQAVPEAGIFGRIWDSILLMFSKKK
ncbi:peptidase [Burkholderia ubonensis]|uniref:D-alanyl-D-alanine carboxypeptidase family protein n=1 Tax=Burkholderia ubonensis TaxID=101571 RepID=UPI00075B6657|nr:D-alanyl-D-alanine carboxypeptidase family protein [Burkholderia ubonensis]KVO51398.1 peptidase [Burkholderia ubonensis]KVX41556.1 peptidase [Burkholderia ubonensis]KWI99741.1 peptidase [Burkholderia ubonensis]KWK14339.1 peptidase [Burkholderia ubonensis]KWK35852.1 peptidase [Burkholderia ubonensis]